MICVTDNYFSCSQVCRVAEVQLLLAGLGWVISPLWAPFSVSFWDWHCLGHGLLAVMAETQEANSSQADTSEASAHYFP